MDILLVKVIENKKYPGGKFCYCDVLISPALNDVNFESVDMNDWEWTARNFEYPLFKKMKNGVFLISLERESGSISMCVHEDSELKSKADYYLSEFNKKKAEDWRILGEKLEKSGFFKPLEGPIEL